MSVFTDDTLFCPGIRDSAGNVTASLYFCEFSFLITVQIHVYSIGLTLVCGICFFLISNHYHCCQILFYGFTVANSKDLKGQSSCH